MSTSRAALPARVVQAGHADRIVPVVRLAVCIGARAREAPSSGGASAVFQGVGDSPAHSTTAAHRPARSPCSRSPAAPRRTPAHAFHARGGRREWAVGAQARGRRASTRRGAGDWGRSREIPPRPRRSGRRACRPRSPRRRPGPAPVLAREFEACLAECVEAEASYSMARLRRGCRASCGLLRSHKGEILGRCRGDRRSHKGGGELYPLRSKEAGNAPPARAPAPPVEAR